MKYIKKPSFSATQAMFRALHNHTVWLPYWMFLEHSDTAENSTGTEPHCTPKGCPSQLPMWKLSPVSYNYELDSENYAPVPGEEGGSRGQRQLLELTVDLPPPVSAGPSSGTRAHPASWPQATAEWSEVLAGPRLPCPSRANFPIMEMESASLPGFSS